MFSLCISFADSNPCVGSTPTCAAVRDRSENESEADDMVESALEQFNDHPATVYTAGAFAKACVSCEAYVAERFALVRGTVRNVAA